MAYCEARRREGLRCSAAHRDLLDRPARPRTLNEGDPGAVVREGRVHRSFGAGNNRGVELIDRATEEMTGGAAPGAIHEGATVWRDRQVRHSPRDVTFGQRNGEAPRRLWRWIAGAAAECRP